MSHQRGPEIFNRSPVRFMLQTESPADKVLGSGSQPWRQFCGTRCPSLDLQRSKGLATEKRKSPQLRFGKSAKGAAAIVSQLTENTNTNAPIFIFMQ